LIIHSGFEYLVGDKLKEKKNGRKKEEGVYSQKLVGEPTSDMEEEEEEEVRHQQTGHTCWHAFR